MEGNRKKIEEDDGAQSPHGSDPSCGCLTAPADNGVDLINHLESIRDARPALHYLFLPDEIWSEFKTWHQEPDGAAAHHSMLLLALDRGHLTRMTGPIHRYLIENGGPHPGLRRQYVKSLREKWMFYEDPLERHQRIAVAVIDNTTWWRFEWQLENQWIDWANPSFFDWDAEWEAFMKGQKGRYPDLRSELVSVLRGIDEVWIVRRSSGYEYHLEYRIRTSNF